MVLRVCALRLHGVLALVGTLMVALLRRIVAILHGFLGRTGWMDLGILTKLGGKLEVGA